MIGDPAPPASTDGEPPRLRASFSRVLRVGVIVSAIFLLVGLGLALAHGSVGGTGRPGAAPLAEFAGELATGQAWAYLWLGVAVLAATPVVRVALALGNFARARDRDFVAITGFVFAVLIASLVVGISAG